MYIFDCHNFPIDFTCSLIYIHHLLLYIFFSVNLVITEDILKKMVNYKMELRVWDVKEKLSQRARFDRPKSFRLPAPKAGINIELNDRLSLIHICERTRKELPGSVMLIDYMKY